MSKAAALSSKASVIKSEKSSPQHSNHDVSPTSRSPVDEILFLQRTVGNQAVQRLFKSGVIQAKLKIGQPGDKYEQEADRVAEQIIRMPEPQIQRQPEDEEKKKEEEGLIQPKGESGSSQGLSLNIASRIEAIKSGGQPLTESTRGYFEQRFGHNFGDVRVHTDTEAAKAAKSLNARAFTIGRDVAFGPSQYGPETQAGKRLLAHELTHVVQQSNTGISLSLQRQESEKVQSSINGKISKDMPGPVTDKSNSQFTLTINNPPPGKYYYFRWSVRDAENNAFRMRSAADNLEVWSYRDSKNGRRVYINTPSLQAMFDKGAAAGCRVLCRVIKTDSPGTPGFYHPLTESNTRVFSINFDFNPGRQFIYPKIRQTIFKELEYRVYFDQDAVLKAFQSAESNEVARIVRDLKLHPHLEHGNYYRFLMSEMKADLTDGQWNQFVSIIGTPTVTGEVPLQLSTAGKQLLSFLESQIEKPNVSYILKQMGGAKSTDLDVALTTLRRRYDSTYGHKLHQLSTVVRKNGTSEQYLKYLSILHESKLAQALRETDPMIGAITKEQSQLAREGKPSDLTDTEMAGLFATRALEIAYTMLRNSEAQVLRVLTRTRGGGEQRVLDAKVKETLKVLNDYFDPDLPDFERFASEVKSAMRKPGHSVSDKEIRLQMQIVLHRHGAVRMLYVVDRIDELKTEIDRDRGMIRSLKHARKRPIPVFVVGPGQGLMENQRRLNRIRTLSRKVEVLERRKSYMEDLQRKVEKAIPVLGGLKKEGLRRLIELKGGSTEFHRIRNESLMGIIENIEKAREYLHEGDVKVWLLPPIVAQTRRALGISGDPTNDAQKRWHRVIKENINIAEKDEKKVQEILDILDIGGLILALGTALFTGGGSLALYAAVGSEVVHVGTSIYKTSEAYYTALAQEITYGTGLTAETRIGDIPATYQPFYDALLGLGIDVALAAVTLKSVYISRQSSRLRGGKEIGQEQLNQIADDLSAQGVKVSKDKIIRALEQKLKKVQELELKAAKIEQQYQKAVKSLVTTSGKLNMVIVPGTEEFAKLVLVAYYAAKRGVTTFQLFLVELKVRKLISDIDKLSPDELRSLKRVFDEGVTKSKTGLLNYKNLSHKARSVYSVEEIEDIAAQGKLLGISDDEIYDFLEAGAIAGASKKDVLSKMDIYAVKKSEQARKISKEMPEGTQHDFEPTHQRSSASTAGDRYKTTPVGGWISGNRGDGLCEALRQDIRDILSKKGLKGIVYRNGYPDFSPIAFDEIPIKMTASREENFKRAFEAFGKKWKMTPKQAENRIKSLGLTPHEAENSKVLLVNSKVHSYFTHYGGVAEERLLRGVSKASERLRKEAGGK
jgi:hypothetical protein